MADEGGRKFDTNWKEKPPIMLIPLKAMWEIGKVMGYGATKYDQFNWKAGIKYSRLISAAMRHLIQFACGEDNDSETSISHLAHCGCCITMLLEMTMDRPDMDDRYKGEQKLPWKKEE